MIMRYGVFGKFMGRRVASESGKKSDSVLDEYLRYMRSVASVEPVGNDTYCLTLPFWSLPATKDSAVTGSDDPNPWVRLYVARVGDSWEISDHGENLGVIAETVTDFDAMASDFQQWLSARSLSSGMDNALRVSSDGWQSLGEAIHNMVLAVSELDESLTDAVRQAFGHSEVPSVFDLNGNSIRFSGQVVRQLEDWAEDAIKELPKIEAEEWIKNLNKNWTSESFVLSRGALAVSFEHSGRHGCKVSLVRDDPGFFDSPTTLFESDDKISGLGLWRVEEGEWRDPHPGVSYHIEVSGIGEFECVMFQPELGQAAVQFPYSTSGSGGATLAGPFRVGSRPIMANLRHDGGGNFFVELVALDGTDECEVVNTDGQANVEDYPVEVRPGKEYLLYAGAGGDWELELTEGY